MEQIIFDCFIAYYGLVFIFDIGFAVDTDFFLFGIQLWHQQNKVSAYFAWCMILWSYEGGEEDIGREGKQKIIGRDARGSLFLLRGGAEEKILGAG